VPVAACLWAFSYAALTGVAIALTFRGHGLTRRTGAVIIAGYCVFVSRSRRITAFVQSFGSPYAGK